MSRDEDTGISTSFKISFVIVTIFLVLLGFSAYDINKKRDDAENMFLSELERANLTVFSCSINSLSIVVTIERPGGFIMVAKSLDRRSVYRTYRCPRTFYVFNEHLTMAWVYEAEWKDFFR